MYVRHFSYQINNHISVSWNFDFYLSKKVNLKSKEVPVAQSQIFFLSQLLIEFQVCPWKMFQSWLKDLKLHLFFSKHQLFLESRQAQHKFRWEQSHNLKLFWTQYSRIKETILDCWLDPLLLEKLPKLSLATQYIRTVSS